jgi:hypothetical protein
MGVISTPPRGGTIFLSRTKKGSVGQAIRLNGNCLRLTWGYQVKMIRKINKKVMTPRRGPTVQEIRSTPLITLVMTIS